MSYHFPKGPKKIQAECREAFYEFCYNLVNDHPNETYKWYTSEINKEFSVDYSTSGVYKILKKYGTKKNAIDKTYKMLNKSEEATFKDLFSSLVISEPKIAKCPNIIIIPVKENSSMFVCQMLSNKLCYKQPLIFIPAYNSVVIISEDNNIEDILHDVKEMLK